MAKKKLVPPAKEKWKRSKEAAVPIEKSIG